MTDTLGNGPAADRHSPEARPLRLLVVDDHEVVRQGLAALLDRRDELPGRRRGRHGRRGDRAGARRFQPDLVIMDVRLPDGIGHRGVPRDPGRASRDPGRDADQLPGRGGGAVGHRRRRQRLPAQAGPRAATSSRRSRPSAAASRCSTRRSPRRSSSASAASRPAPYTDELAAAHRPGAEDPAARRRGQDQQGDRGARSSCPTRRSRTTSARSSPS